MSLIGAHTVVVIIGLPLWSWKGRQESASVSLERSYAAACRVLHSGTRVDLIMQCDGIVARLRSKHDDRKATAVDNSLIHVLILILSVVLANNLLLLASQRSVEHEAHGAFLAALAGRKPYMRMGKLFSQ